MSKSTARFDGFPVRGKFRSREWITQNCVCRRCGKPVGRPYIDPITGQLDHNRMCCGGENRHEIRSEADIMPRRLQEWREDQEKLGMPIKGLQTDKIGMPVGGKISLGIKKVSSKGKEYPAEADHFVLARAEDLVPFYGPEPRVLYGLLPYAELDDNFRAWMELYSGGGCLCRGDGESIQKMIDPNGGGDVVVKNGMVVGDFDDTMFDEGGKIVVSRVVGEVLPCGGIEAALYPRCSDCHPRAILSLIIADPNSPAKMIRPAIYTIATGSQVNIRNITESLKLLEQLGQRCANGMMMMPVIVRRYSMKISAKITNQQTGEDHRGQVDKWFVSLEYNPALEQTIAAALTAGSRDYLELEAGEDQEADMPIPEPIIDGEIVAEINDRLANTIADIQAMDQPRTHGQVRMFLQDVFGTSYEEKAFFMAVRKRLGMEESTRLQVNAEVWKAIVDEVIERLSAPQQQELFDEDAAR